MFVEYINWEDKMQKRCEVCSNLFEADVRVGDRQRVCSKQRCKQERKRRCQQRWLSKNPNYFKGRYANTKIWLSAHPDYLKNYRASRNQTDFPPGFCDIQVKLTYCKCVTFLTLIYKARLTNCRSVD